MEDVPGELQRVSFIINIIIYCHLIYCHLCDKLLSENKKSKAIESGQNTLIKVFATIAIQWTPFGFFVTLRDTTLESFKHITLV